ncbi:MAG TPA: hypothetical protein ENK84_00335 [Desulfobulbus sp.]|nr:hypothetical protein [Desulfobulbus sp.]
MTDLFKNNWKIRLFYKSILRKFGPALPNYREKLENIWFILSNGRTFFIYEQVGLSPEQWIAGCSIAGGNIAPQFFSTYLLFYKQLPGGCQGSSFAHIMLGQGSVRFRTDTAARGKVFQLT